MRRFCALDTDLYELNMAASFLGRGMTAAATFSLFIRRLPPQRGFLVAAGLDDCLALLEGYRFEDEELAWLRDSQGFGDETVEHLRRLRFTGDVRAVPEGRVVLAGEPIIEVTAPVAEAQLVETALLNQVTFQTTIASKAARCRIAARGAGVVDFAFRRTHGVDAAVAVARCTALVGFAGTSNVAAARRYGLRTSGTMAHSFIEAFVDEADAFRAFASDCPGRTTFLVDTYDTINGIRTAIDVIRELDLQGPVGLRIDSGDLLALTREARRMLDEAGLEQARVVVSGGLDEHDVDRLVRDGAPIDVFGVGTRIGVSADHPYLDSAYKLVEYDGRPVLKLSTGKTSAPGAKQVFRSRDPLRDVIGLRDEPVPEGAEPLLVPVMRNGRRVDGCDLSLTASRARFEDDLALLPEEALRLRDPVAPQASLSPALTELSERVTRETRERALGES